MRSIGSSSVDKGFLKKASVKKVGELLRLTTDQLRIMTGLLSGHSHLKGHLFKLGLVNSPECDASRHLKQPHKFFITVKLWQP
jgi:hypothetical protein